MGKQKWGLKKGSLGKPVIKTNKIKPSVKQIKFYKQSSINQLVWYILHLLDNKFHQELFVNNRDFYISLISESSGQKPGN